MTTAWLKKTNNSSLFGKRKYQNQQVENMNNHLPSSQLVIRPASYNDIPIIRAIAAQTWPAAYGLILEKHQLDYMLDQIYSSESLTKQIKDKHYFFLAMKDYEPIGFASFSQVEGSVYKLQKIYVVPATQKSGAGKALLETVEKVAKSMGAEKLQLNVNRQNNAQLFYAKEGFKILREEDIEIGKGYFMNDYIMEKAL